MTGWTSTSIGTPTGSVVAVTSPLQASLLDSHTTSVLIQLVLGVIASTFAVKLLTLRQDRRKIAGDASAQEANAASILSGTALQMVEAAQRSAHEAEQKAIAAEARADQVKEEAEQKIGAAQAEATRMWHELQRAGWEIHWLQIRERLLELALRGANIEIPEIPQSMLEAFPDWDAPPNLPNHLSAGKHQAKEPEMGDGDSTIGG